MWPYSLVRNCPCDLAYSWRAPHEATRLSRRSGYCRASHARRIACRHTKAGRIASINLGTSTLAIQRMHCDYQLWMHLLTLSPHPRPLIGQHRLTQRLFSVLRTPSDHFLPPFFAATQLSFPAPRLTAAPGRALGPESAFLGASRGESSPCLGDFGITFWQDLWASSAPCETRVRND